MAFTTSLLDERVTIIVAQETVLPPLGQHDLFGNPVNLHAVHVANGAGQTAYIYFYDARAGALGQTPDLTFMVINGQTRTFYFPDGIEFSTGVCVRCTNSEVQSGNTTPTGSAVVVTFIGVRT